MEKERISKKDKSLSRARLNLLKLSPLQHQMLLRWFHDSRKTYNLALRYVFGGTNNIFFFLFDKFQSNAWAKTMLQKMFVSGQGVCMYEYTESRNKKNRPHSEKQEGLRNEKTV